MNYPIWHSYLLNQQTNTMIQKLKTFWLFLFGDKVKLAQKKSDRIFNVFTETQKNVQKQNTEIEAHVGVKTAKVEKLNKEVDVLATVAARNQKLSNKISDFLKD